MTKKPWYQQGDVIIQPLSHIKGLEFPLTGKTAKKDQRGYILAEGEVTGHAHALEDIPGVEVIEAPARITREDGVVEEVRYFIRVSGKTKPTLKHEEHNTHTIPPGEYIVRGVREYDHFAEEARRVID